MNQVAVITNALISNSPVLALPRWRVIADVRERFRCCESAAREAYALARAEGHARNRRDTTPYAKVERQS